MSRTHLKPQPVPPIFQQVGDRYLSRTGFQSQQRPNQPIDDYAEQP